MTVALPAAEFLRTKEAAAFLRIHPATLRLWRRQGIVKAVQVNSRCVRYRREDLLAIGQRESK